MSLFKSISFWSSKVAEDETFDYGCISVEENINFGTRIFVGGHSGTLKVYQTKDMVEENLNNVQNENFNILCEMNLSDPIIQTEVARFIGGVDEMSLLVLHTKKMTVFKLIDGNDEENTRKTLKLSKVYEHGWEQTAFNCFYGPFGSIKNKDLIGVQHMNCSVSIFEQEIPAYQLAFPASTLPSLISYLPCSDFIVVTSSCRSLRAFEFQKLATKKQESDIESMAKWSYCTEDDCVQMSVVSGEQEKVVFLGERYLYVFSNGGSLLFLKKLLKAPTSFFAYYDADSKEKKKRDLNIKVIVTNIDYNLLVYDGDRTAWVCAMDTNPVQVLRLSSGSNRGSLIALDERGRLDHFYLGTRPSKHLQERVEGRSYEGVLEEVQKLQKELKNITLSSILETKSKGSHNKNIKISTNVQKGADINTMREKVRLRVSVESEQKWQELLVVLLIGNDFEAEENLHVLSDTVAKETYTVTFDLTRETDLIYPESTLKVLVLGNDSKSTLVLGENEAKVQSDGNASWSKGVFEDAHTLSICMEAHPWSLSDLYPDLKGAEDDCIAFNTKLMEEDDVNSKVFLSKNNQNEVQIRSRSFASIWVVVEDWMQRVEKRASNIHSLDSIPFDAFLSVVEQYDSYMEEHARMRRELEECNEQCKIVQKTLITKLKDNPTSLKQLQILLETTLKLGLSIAERLQQHKKLISKSLSDLSASSQLLLFILHSKVSEKNLRMLEGCLRVDCTSTSQTWLELVGTNIGFLLHHINGMQRNGLSFKPPHVTFDTFKRDFETLSHHLEREGKIDIVLS